MSENTTVQTESIPNIEITAIEKPLTAREVFDNITELQKQMTQNPYHAMSSLEGSVDSICGADESEDKCKQIEEVCNVFLMRERTFSEMLALYRKMYEDLSAAEVEKNAAKRQIANEMTSIMKNQLSSGKSRKEAIEILKAYMSDK